MRVSSLALTKILTHCVGTNDERLTKITVEGEEVTVHSEGIQTRSKRAAGASGLYSIHSSQSSLPPPSLPPSLLPSFPPSSFPSLLPPSRLSFSSFLFPSAPQQWTKVPLPVKVLKLLISDIQNGIEAQTAGQGEEEEEGGSDEEEVSH